MFFKPKERKTNTLGITPQPKISISKLGRFINTQTGKESAIMSSSSRYLESMTSDNIVFTHWISNIYIEQGENDETYAI